MTSNNDDMLSWRREWAVVLILIAPFITLAIVWSSLPARIPTHFDLHGKVDHYGNPATLFILPCINILVALLLYYIPRLDPKQTNILESMTSYRWIRIAIAAFFTFVFALTLINTLNATFDVEQLIAVGLLALFLVIGLALPKIKSNYMIGIRLPWTLESDDNWNRTHAFAGKLWPWGSLVGIVLALVFPSFGIFIALGIIILLAIWTSIFSYRLFKHQAAQNG